MKSKDLKKINYRPSRMEANYIKNPYKATEHFFSFFTLQDCRHNLWELYERCVMSYSREGTEHNEVSNILFFYTLSEMLYEAAWIIDRKLGRKRKKAHKRTRDNHIKRT
jgi:hypothetical protein